MLYPNAGSLLASAVCARLLYGSDSISVSSLTCTVTVVMVSYFHRIHLFTFHFTIPQMSGHYVTEDLAQIAREIQLERIKQQQLITQKTRAEIEKARRFEESRCYQCLSGKC